MFIYSLKDWFAPILDPYDGVAFWAQLLDVFASARYNGKRFDVANAL